MSYEHDRAQTNGFLVPEVTPFELKDEPVEQEGPDVRELGVDDRDRSGVDVCEGCSLGLGRHDVSDKETLTSD